MRAVQINNYGGEEVLEINNLASTPVPTNDQVLVQVHSVSVNPFDIALVSGALKDKIPLKFPFIVGGDFSGTILETKVDVFGSAQAIAGNSGAFAEFLTVSSESTAPKPKTASFEEAAALPLAGISAIQALEDHIKLKNDQKILIHGGAGGIGHIAIQIAKAIGAHVVTTVSTSDVDFVKSLGADVVIDYKKEDFTLKVKEMDAVYDTVGGEVKENSIKVLKKGGAIVSMKGPPNPTLAQDLGITSIVQMTKVNIDHLNRLTKYVELGQVKVKIEKIYDLGDIQQAFKNQTLHPKGKIVLKVI